MRFNDLLVAKDGMIKGPFGGDIKKSLFVTKGPNTYKVLEQSVVLNKDITLGNYYLDSEYVEKKLKRFIVKDGDILITGAGTLGQIFEVNNLIEPAVINQALIRIRLNANIVNKKYFKYYFKYSVLRMIEGINGDSVIPNLPPLSIIKDTKINIPDLPTQQKIAAVLSALDDKIELNNKINAELEAMAKTLYDYWFVQFEFPFDFAQGKPSAEGKPYKSSGGKMVYNETLKREIPEGWEVKKLELLGNFKNGVNYDPSKPGLIPCPIINVRNISNSSFFIRNDDLDVIYLNQNDVNKYAVNEDSIIIARSGIPGATRLINNHSPNTLYCGFAIHYQLENTKLRNYIFFFLKSIEENINKGSGGTIMKNVNQATLNNLKITIPPIDIIQKFNETIDSIFQKILNIEKQNQELATLRDWLLPMLMNGQVRVEDTYGSTEPQANLAAEAATEHQN